MEELKGYQHHRLDLADMIRAVLYIARVYGDGQREHGARQLLERLAAGRFQLAVAGQFSRGKTTLLNALLGAPYLPMGALPMTSVVTTVRYGSRPRATVRRRGSPLPVEAPLTEVARFVAQASAERAELQVSSVEVEVPAEILRLGFEFADTPGIGSAIEVNTAATARFLPHADAVIVVTGFDSPLTQAETDFLTHMGEHAGKLFVVINKRDLISERDAAEVTGYVQQWLRNHLPLGEPQVFGLSALEALQASLQGDHERMAASGVLALRAALAEFLTTGKAKTYLQNVAARAADLVAGQGRDLRLGALAADGAPGKDIAAAFDARIEEHTVARHALAQQIAMRVRDGLPGRLAERGPAWQASLQELVASLAGDVPAGDANPAEGQLEDAVAMLEQAGREITRDWLDRRTAEVHELLIGLAAADIGALLEHARSPRAIGAQIAGLASADGRSGPTGWSAEDVPALAAPRVQWSVPVPAKRPRRRAGAEGVRLLLSDALKLAATEFAERAREAFETAAQDWASRLGGQAGRQTAEAADQVRVYLRTAPREEDLTALQDLAARLTQFRASLDAWNPAVDAMPAETGAAVLPAQPGSCPVCSRMGAALTDHLRGDQFLLATRERDQARHARAGGFCPMHTWQYAGMASPLGIAAGYARLAATMAAALEDITHRSSAGELADSVTGLIRASTCPVCTALARCETSEVTRIASQAPATGSAAPLCLHHLALVLTVRPAPSTSQAMIRALAEALRRASQDMREYALKREARHSGLVTDEESRAHSDVLRLLAGQPALARPWHSETNAGHGAT